MDQTVALRSEDSAEVRVFGKDNVQQNGIYQSLKQHQHSKIEHYGNHGQLNTAGVSAGSYFSIEGAGVGNVILFESQLDYFSNHSKLVTRI